MSYTHYRPCYRHNSGSLPSVENHNYLGRSVPPAVLFKHSYGSTYTHGWYWENCHDERAATCFLLCVLFSKGEDRIAPVWLKLVCAWVSLQLFKTSQPYIVQMEIPSYSCKIIFRNVCKAISCDKSHSLLLDKILSGAVPPWIIKWCFASKQFSSFQMLHPAERPS